MKSLHKTGFIVIFITACGVSYLIYNHSKKDSNFYSFNPRENKISPTEKYKNSGANESSSELHSPQNNKKTIANNSFNDNYLGYSGADRVRAIERDRIFQLSRNSNDAKLKIELLKALRRGIISSNEYYGELAHMLSVSGLDNIAILLEIVDSKNNYGMEVMYSSLASNPVWIQELSESNKKIVLDNLMRIRPTFSGYVSELGMSEVYRYENWIKSLENSYYGSDFDNFLYEKIVASALEPRDFLALKYSGYLERLKTSDKKFNLTEVDQVISDYKKFYPNNDAANIIIGSPQPANR